MAASVVVGLVGLGEMLVAPPRTGSHFCRRAAVAGIDSTRGEFRRGGFRCGLGVDAVPARASR
jgi:hypothetical protein